MAKTITIHIEITNNGPIASNLNVKKLTSSEIIKPMINKTPL